MGDTREKTPGQALDAVLATLATKDDVRQLSGEVRTEMAAAKTAIMAATKAEIRTEVRAEMAAAKIDILAATKAEISTEVKAEMAAAKADILAAINGGIEQLRSDLNTEFAKHKVPVKLATRKKA